MASTCAPHGTQFRAEIHKVQIELDKARAEVKRLKETRCTVREHDGIEKVVGKIGLEQSLLPDPELGQDVAFLAFVISSQKKSSQILTDLLHRINGRGSAIHLDKDVEAILSGTSPTGASEGYAEKKASAK